jgi:hypothetical protein
MTIASKIVFQSMHITVSQPPSYHDLAMGRPGICHILYLIIFCADFPFWYNLEYVYWEWSDVFELSLDIKLVQLLYYVVVEKV